MTKLLIIDDKKDERQSLKNLIDWSAYGISIVGEASNGLEGFTLANKLLPDIVMTDIVMPEMDGISLIVKLRKSFQNMKIIIMSCYSEFRYAQYAVKYKVSDYILKPIISTELEHVIKKVQTEIARDKATGTSSQEYIEDLVEDNLNELKNVFIRDLLNGKYQFSDSISEKLKIYQLQQFSSGKMMVLLIECGSLSVFPGLCEAVEGVGSSLSKFVLQTEKNQYAVLLGGKGITDCYRQLPYDLKGELKNCGFHEVTIGASSIKDNIREISSCYQEAQQALNAAFYLGKNRVIFYSELSNITFSTKDLDLKDIYDQLQNILHTGNKADIAEFTDNIINACIKKNKLYVKIVAINIISCCQIFLLNTDYGFSDIFKENEKEIYEKIMMLDAIPEIREWLFKILSQINNFLVEKNKSSKILITEKVSQIIKDRYFEKLTLDGIAAEIHYHPVYINSLIKQTTGKTFLQLLIEFRLKKAMELLQNTNLKVHEICRKVGYWNQSYFIQAFREYTGTTPGEFRALHLAEGDKK